MSWFVGIHSKNHQYRDEHIQKINSFCLNNLYYIKTESLVLIAGGILDTCICSLMINPHHYDEGWLVTGVGMEQNNDIFTIIGLQRWNTLLSQPTVSLESLNGQFTVIRWNRDRIEFFSDAFGIRKMYYSFDQKDLLFSSRLDWITTMRQRNEFAIENLSSFWNCINSYEITNSFIRGIAIVPPMAHFIVSERENTLRWKFWSPERIEHAEESLISLLNSSLSIPSQLDRDVLLSMSAGLDSRTLYSMLCNQKEREWAALTFGNENSPDIRLTQVITKKTQKKCITRIFTLPNPDELLSFLKTISLQMEMRADLCHSFFYSLLPEFSQGNHMIMSGSFGEILREFYGNRLLYYGSRAIKLKNYTRLAKLLNKPKARIFTKEAAQTMEIQCENHIQKSVETMPELASIGIKNWIALFILRYRIGNESMAYYDSLVPNMMPFVQPALLNCIFSISPNRRRNSAVNAAIIKNHAPILESIPLVKDGCVYPYRVCQNTFVSKVWIHFMKKLHLSHQSTFHIQILNHVKEHVLDRVESQSVRHFFLYDYRLIQSYVSAFYDQKQYHFASAIMDWLSFDFWREDINLPQK